LHLLGIPGIYFHTSGEEEGEIKGKDNYKLNNTIAIQQEVWNGSKLYI